jgi:hypothetical protein
VILLKCARRRRVTDRSRILCRIVSGQEGCDHAKQYDVEVKARGVRLVAEPKVESRFGDEVV